MGRKRVFYPIKDSDIMKRILTNTDTTYALIMKIILMTGMRLEDVLKLKQRDMSRDGVMYKAEVLHYLPNGLIDELIYYLHDKHGVFVFSRENGDQITTRMFQGKMSKLESEFKIPMSYMVLKKTYYYYIYTNTGDVDYLKTKGANRCHSIIGELLGVTKDDIRNTLRITKNNERTILQSIYKTI